MPETSQRPPIATAPLSVVLTACNPGNELEQVVTTWKNLLNGLKRDYEILLVHDGSNDGADAPAEPCPRVRVFHQEGAAQGLGASLRTGIGAARFPLLVTATADERFQPADLQRMLAAIDEVDIVTGYRVGRPIPEWLRTLDLFYRVFMRVLFGMPMPARQCWLGWSGWGRRRLMRLLGVRVQDPECALRLFRRSIFKRIPLQSNGVFALIEILAKANFLGSLIAEVPVTVSADERAATVSDPQISLFREMRRVFTHADFGPVVIPPGDESFATLPPAAPPPPSENEPSQTTLAALGVTPNPS